MINNDKSHVRIATDGIVDDTQTLSTFQFIRLQVY